MDFYAHIESNHLLRAELLKALRSSISSKHTTAYKELYNNYTAYGITEDDLYNWVRGADANIIIIESSKGMECDRETYKKLIKMKNFDDKLGLFLLDSLGNRVLLTQQPDNINTYGKAAKVYGDAEFKLAVCRETVWDSVFQFYIEPVLLEQKALNISQSQSNQKEGNDVQESEARSLYNSLIHAGIDRRASDIHLIPCSNVCEVHFRVDGKNYRYTNLPKDIAEKICNIVKVDAKVAVKNPLDPIDGKVLYHVSEEKKIDLRLSIIPTKHGSDLNIRYLTSKQMSFEDLGMTKRNISTYKHLLELPQGLIIQVGPTGSGKSTTLYAGLSHIHKSLRNIITVEDPVEILMDGISQVDVATDTKLGFAEALKATLRHDPDVVVVGELRDAETAAEAIRAANTGHLVLTSLHTNDSIGVFERMVNLGVDPYSLGEVLVAIMGQRLVRRLCPHCIEEYRLTSKEDIIRFNLEDSAQPLIFYKSNGCLGCRNTGYIGRVALNEVLVVDSVLRELIQTHVTRSHIEKHLRKNKFVSLYGDGMYKALSGITSLEELAPLASDTTAYKY